MGANQQTSVPAFVQNQVLTAQQMTEVNTGVPVFADSTARDAAFGGTGEKVLAEGQLAYLENLDIVQYYDGSNWLTLGPSTPGGLVYLTGAAFTTATSFSLPNSTFTSSYRNYKIVITVTALTSDADFTIRMRAAGSDNTTGSYNTQIVGHTATGGTANLAQANQTSWNASESDGSLVRYQMAADVFNPQLAVPTTLFATYTYVDKPPTATFMRTGSHQFESTTQFDSLSFISSVASSMTGVYRVYGYADS